MYPREVKTCVYTEACMRMFIRDLKKNNTLKLEANSQSLNRWIVKESVIYLCLGIPLNNKNKWIIDTPKSLHGSLEKYAEWKKPIPKGHVLNYSIDALEMSKLQKQRTLMLTSFQG